MLFKNKSKAPDVSLEDHVSTTLKDKLMNVLPAARESLNNFYSSTRNPEEQLLTQSNEQQNTTYSKKLGITLAAAIMAGTVGYNASQQVEREQYHFQNKPNVEETLAYDTVQKFTDVFAKQQEPTNNQNFINVLDNPSAVAIPHNSNPAYESAMKLLGHETPTPTTQESTAQTPVQESDVSGSTASAGSNDSKPTTDTTSCSLTGDWQWSDDLTTCDSIKIDVQMLPGHGLQYTLKNKHDVPAAIVENNAFEMQNHLLETGQLDNILDTLHVDYSGDTGVWKLSDDDCGDGLNDSWSAETTYNITFAPTPGQAITKTANSSKDAIPCSEDCKQQTRAQDPGIGLENLVMNEHNWPEPEEQEPVARDETPITIEQTPLEEDIVVTREREEPTYTPRQEPITTPAVRQERTYTRPTRPNRPFSVHFSYSDTKVTTSQPAFSKRHNYGGNYRAHVRNPCHGATYQNCRPPRGALAGRINPQAQIDFRGQQRAGYGWSHRNRQVPFNPQMGFDVRQRSSPGMPHRNRSAPFNPQGTIHFQQRSYSPSLYQNITNRGGRP